MTTLEGVANAELVVSLNRVSKRFGPTAALDGVSL
jgi:hypothetical protein